MRSMSDTPGGSDPFKERMILPSFNDLPLLRGKPGAPASARPAARAAAVVPAGKFRIRMSFAPPAQTAIDVKKVSNTASPDA